jgi:hypothetical protein
MAEKEGAKDIVSRRISIFSLVISTLSFFYGNIDERFYGSVSVSSTTAQVTGSEEKPGILVQGIALTFINAGNRPIAIEHVSYAILGSEGKPNEECSDKDDPVHKKPKNYFVWSSRAVKTVTPDNFQAFTIKPGDTEVKVYNFSGTLDSDELRPIDERMEARFLAGCLFITSNSQANGRKYFVILASIDDIGKNGQSSTLSGQEQIVTLVNARWPFYLITNLLSSWRSNDDDLWKPH